MPEAWPALVLAVVLAATAVVLTVWGHYSERRPRHAGAGPGALTVAQLREEIEMPDETGEMPAIGRGRWSHWRGELPDVGSLPGSPILPGSDPECTSLIVTEEPHLALMRRVLAGLHRL